MRVIEILNPKLSGRFRVTCWNGKTSADITMVPRPFWKQVILFDAHMSARNRSVVGLSVGSTWFYCGLFARLGGLAAEATTCRTAMVAHPQ